MIRRTTSALYALALRSFPKAHRAQYREEMIAGFRNGYLERVEASGQLAGLGFGLTATANALSAGWGERRRVNSKGLPGQRGRVLEGLISDLRYASRALARAPMFTAICTISLGLGLGAVFTIALFVNFLHTVPAGVQTEDMVEVVVEPSGPLRPGVGGWAIETWAYPDYLDLRDTETGLSLAGWDVADSVLSASDIAPLDVSAMFVTPGYFELIGVSAAEGRVLTADDGGLSSPGPGVIISHRLWTTIFDSDPTTVGRAVRVNRREHVVVGIVADGFRGHINSRGARQADVWLPLGHHPIVAAAPDIIGDRSADWLHLAGRLDAGVTREQANGTIVALSSQLAEDHPATHEFRRGTAAPYASTGTNQIFEMAAISVLFYAMSGAVLVIVCLNIAGMMLVRTASRRQELAVREALGASRWRLARYLMSESVVMALIGGVIGIATLRAATVTLVWWFGGTLPPEWELTPSRIGACLLLALATTLLFGLLPSFRFSRGGMLSAMNDDAGGGGWKVGRAHRVAAALQAGVALPFFALGGLLFHSAQTAAVADLGFQPDGLYAASLRVQAAGYSEVEADAFVQGARERLEASPGVTRVAVADGLPLDYEYRRTRVRLPSEEISRARTQVTRVGSRYLETLGARVLRGRGIDAQDHAGAAPVAVISESLAARLFPAGNGIGESIVTAIDGDRDGEFTVVGVVADLATSQMQTERPQMFVPIEQQPSSRVYLVARARSDLEGMSATFSRVIAELDPDFTRPTVMSGEQLVDDSVADLLEQSTLSAVTAATALALSALGIYGVVAFMVTSRRREMGVRIALGATRRKLLVSVLIDTCRLIAPGLILGLALARVAVTQTGLLWEAPGLAEPVAYTAAVMAALVVAIIASLPSANRAAAIEPLEAIRAE
ncbi:MAG: FtsX-like permease family protein [Acidobacteria bacterium]|nr:FtsX-like permease family protein [Acidobacteriota bacterium]